MFEAIWSFFYSESRKSKRYPTREQLNYYDRGKIDTIFFGNNKKRTKGLLAGTKWFSLVKVRMTSAKSVFA